MKTIIHIILSMIFGFSLFGVIEGYSIAYICLIPIGGFYIYYGIKNLLMFIKSIKSID